MADRSSGALGRLPALSRRDALRLGAVAGAASLTASWLRVGSDVLAQSSGTPTGGQYHGYWGWSVPPVGHFNSFLPGAITNGIYQGVAEMALAHYRWDTQEFMPLLATAWNLADDGTFTVTLREGVTWSDGSPFTADDVLTTFTIKRSQGAPIWDYVGSIDATDATHLTFVPKSPSTLVPYFALREPIRAHSVYGEWAAKFQAVYSAAGTASPVASPAATPAASPVASPVASPAAEVDTAAITAISTEFSSYHPDAFVVTGPYNIDPSTLTGSQLTMTKVPSSFLANTANFDSLLIYAETDASSIPPLILAKELDYATSGFPPATEQAMIQAGLRIVRPPCYFGPAIYINYDRVKALGDPKVRQALLTAIDRQTNGLVSLASSGLPSKYMAGVPDLLLESWVDADTLAELKPYDLNLDEAAAAFQQLGFTKDGDTWVSPDGERMEYELMVPGNWLDFFTAATNLAEQLTAFGVKTTVRSTSETQYSADLPAGNFQLAIGFWGEGQPHPLFSYRTNLLDTNTLAAGGGIHFPLVQTTESVGEIDFGALITESAAGTDVEAQKKIVGTLARAFNELLPIIPLWERLANDPILDNVRVTGFPDDSNPLFKNSVYNDNFTIQWILDGTLMGVV